MPRDAKTIFPDTFCIHRIRGVCPCLPSILTEYPVYPGVLKPPTPCTLRDNIHVIFYALSILHVFDILIFYSLHNYSTRAPSMTPPTLTRISNHVERLAYNLYILDSVRRSAQKCLVTQYHGITISSIWLSLPTSDKLHTPSLAG